MMEVKFLLGWCSSLVLLATILNQIHTQWKERSSRGVSWLLFIGQIVASIGFVAYSVLVGDWVFIATNSALLASHFLGLWITYKHKK